jgi:hypothetical protein
VAFVLQNTISVTDAASFNSAYVYFWDTLVNGSTGWTVAAHPDASSFKRKMSYTFSEDINNPGNPFTTYFWATWGTVTPTNTNAMTMYMDETYTSVKQDLCTDTDHPHTFTANTASYTGNHKFWRSDQGSRAFLWTYGTYVMCYSPGPTTCIGYPDTDWDNDTNGTETQRSQYNIICNEGGGIKLANSPLYAFNSSGEANGFPYFYGVQSYSGTQMTYNYQDLNPSDTSIVYPILFVNQNQPLIWGCSTDVRVFYPHTLTSTTFDYSIASGNTKKLINGTDWYFGRPSTSQPTLQFFFGITEPDFSF